MHVLKRNYFTLLPKWLLIAMLLNVGITLIAVFCKFYYLQYNGLDLAIFNHAFWQTIHGNYFGSTINPPSYFGDHFAPFLTLLVPFYYIVPSPFTLLFFQTLFLAASAIPFYYIAKRYFSERWVLILTCAWLFNPFLGSLALFEFHTISVIPLLFLTLWYLFITQRTKYYVLILLVTLLVREDVGLSLISMSMVMFLFAKKNKLAYYLPSLTMLFSGVWTVIALYIVKAFSVSESYKFFAYYGWLGDTPLAALETFITSPQTVFVHSFSLDTLSLMFTLLIPSLYLSLLAPTFLLGLAIPLGVFLLTERGVSPLIAFLHYNAWLLVPIYLGVIYGTRKLLDTTSRIRIVRILQSREEIIQLFFAVSIVYFLIFLHPATYTLFTVITDKTAFENEKSLHQIVTALLPPDATVITTAEFLTELSSRRNIQYLRYLYANQYQLSNTPYDFPEDDVIFLFRPNDFVYYDLLSLRNPFLPKVQGEALLTFLSNENYAPYLIHRDYVVLTKQEKSSFDFYKELKSLPQDAHTAQENRSGIIGWDNPSITSDHLLLTIYTYIDSPVETIYHYKVDFYEDDSLLLEAITPPSFGLKTVNSWPTNTVIKTAMLIDTHSIDTNAVTKVTVTPVYIEATNTLGRSLSGKNVIENIAPAGAATTIPMR